MANLVGGVIDERVALDIELMGDLGIILAMTCGNSGALSHTQSTDTPPHTTY